MEKTNDNELIQQFAKNRLKDKIRTSMTAVIYTRVSTKEQAEKNLSLETQLKYCNEYANRNGYRVLAYFGGTYESAKNDERREFIRMQTFIRNSKEPVSHILVYSADRFSRSGPNAIHIASELLKKGIRILPVTQPVDTSTAEGQLQQSIQFIFSQYDNTNRKKKTIDGMIEKMRKGYLIGQAPFGYTQMRIDSEQKIVVNDAGKMLRKAFVWKTEGLTTAEIAERLHKWGVRVTEKNLSRIFRNIFYCGFISNRLLDGELVEGNHEKLVSKEIFLQANDVLSKNSHAYKHKNENDDLPLKRFLICDQCGQPWVGYLVKKKNIHYYKCNQKGCRCNKNAKQLHAEFAELLNLFSFNKVDEKEIRKELLEMYATLMQEREQESKAVQMELANAKKKLADLKERHALGTVEMEVYQEYKAIYEKEINEILNDFTEDGLEKSNLENFLNHALEMSQNLRQMWVSGDYNEKQKLQHLVFPEGIRYNRQTGYYRTEKMNLTFAAIADQIRVLDKKEGEKSIANFDFSPSVAPRRIEHTKLKTKQMP